MRDWAGWLGGGPNTVETALLQTEKPFIPTVSFSKVVLSQGDVNKVFLGVFLMFLAFFHSKIWAKFHFGTFEPYKKEKS